MRTPESYEWPGVSKEELDALDDQYWNDEAEQQARESSFDDDNAENWQMYGQWEAMQAQYDDDPNPYHGDYSEM